MKEIISDHEKQSLMTFVIDYLQLDAGEAEWENMPDEFFVLMREFLESKTKKEQVLAMQKVSQYIKDLAKQSQLALRTLQKASMKREAELEQASQGLQADNLLLDLGK